MKTKKDLSVALVIPVTAMALGSRPFRGWQSIVNRSLNMFTLIAIGVGAAYFYSTVVMLLPDIFPLSLAAHGNSLVTFATSIHSGR